MPRINRAERRRRSAQWRAAMRRVHRNGAGALSFKIVRRDDIAPAMVALLLGQIDHIEGLTENEIIGIAQWLRARPVAPEPPLCLCCDDVPGLSPAGFAIVSPHRDDATDMMVSAICDACDALGEAHVFGQAMAHYREIWPSLRILDPGHMPKGSGRA